VRIRDGLGANGGSWFEEIIQKKVDNDSNTYQKLSVVDIYSLGWGE